MSKVYSLKAVQKIPVDIHTAWDFFSKPDNLSVITPKNLGFKIRGISKRDDNEMYAGQLIQYTIRPLLKIPLYWMTEITHVNDKKYFIDEQRFGPYSLWQHQHHFREIENGIEMTDIVHYKIPYWFFGDIANKLFVKRQLKNIFRYRYKTVEKKYGRWQNDKGLIRFK